MIYDNDLLVDVRKIAYGKLVWETYSEGQTITRKDRPKELTHRGHSEWLKDIMPPIGVYPRQTRKERIEQRGYVFDVWTPRLSITLNNGHSLEFTNNTALKIWSAYKGYIYNRK